MVEVDLDGDGEATGVHETDRAGDVRVVSSSGVPFHDVSGGGSRQRPGGRLGDGMGETCSCVPSGATAPGS